MASLCVACMKALTLFRFLCGFRWRPIDLVFWPVVEIYGACYYASYLVDPSARSFGGIATVLMNLVSITAGTIARTWVSRNQNVLENFLKQTRREVPVHELIIGVAYVLMYSDVLYQDYLLVYDPDNFRKLVDSTIINHVTAFRFLWIYFIVAILLADVNFYLTTVPARDVLEDYKQCCRVLQSTNSLMNPIPDWLLIDSAFCAVVLASLASFTKNDPWHTLITWAVVLSAPNVFLIIQGGRISAAMYKKRIRVRKLWIREIDVNGEVYAALGHGNALGMRWIADSDYLKFSSALSVLTNIVTYASLILSKPLLADSDTPDFY